MPEILTKYPDILITELKSAGGKCGVGVQQKILVTCPKEKFCSLPAGEICVYDLSNVSSMTQITPADFHEIVTNVPGMFSSANFVLLILMFGLGMAFGMFFFGQKKKR